MLPSIGQLASSDSASSAALGGPSLSPTKMSGTPASLPQQPQPQPQQLQQKQNPQPTLLRQPHAPIRPQQLQPRPLGRLNSSMSPLQARSSAELLVKDWNDPPVARIQQQMLLPRSSVPESATCGTLPHSALPTPFEALAKASSVDPLPPNVTLETSTSLTPADAAEGSRKLSRSQVRAALH